MLLDMAALVAEAGAVEGMEISLHGDAAVEAVRAWAASRGIETPAPEERRHEGLRETMRWTVHAVPLATRSRITAFSDWSPVETAPSPRDRQAIPAIADGGAA